jgi:hypothetical protein
MNAIGLGALEQCDMPQARVVGFNRVEKVRKHGEVGRDLIRLEPAFRQIRFLEQGAVNDVSDAADVAKPRVARRRVGQVDRDMDRAGPGLRQPARQPNDVPFPFREILVDCRATNQPPGAGHKHDSLARHEHISVQTTTGSFVSRVKCKINKNLCDGQSLVGSSRMLRQEETE